jgi:radical SAM superfamily enzyme YgiQ (UPF0313 family)
MTSRVLRTVLVAPSRYDEHGVMVYRIGIVQNGSLAALGGLIEDWNARHAASGRTIQYEIYDEKVRFPVTAELLRTWRDAALARGERFVLMVCGVQTATYPRARDIALQARREGLDVIAGGVHLTAHGPSLDFLVSCGVSVGIGEVETIWDRIVDDCFAGTLAPLYKLGADEGLRVKSGIEDIAVPELERLPYPHVPPEAMRHYLNNKHLFIDSSRGCPFVCSFCVVKNAFGRSMRSRVPSELVSWMADKYEREGIRYFGFIDDNFLRNPRHLEVLEGIAKLRAAGRRFQISLMLDVESSCYARESSPRGERSRRFLELCRAAGVVGVYMGLESTNDGALVEMHKQVNRARKSATGEPGRALIERYRTAVQAWQAIGAWVECGYIIGWDADAPGCGARSAADVLEIGVDVVNFYMIAPLPGAEDFARAKSQGLMLEPDFNEYFKKRPMVKHPVMDSAQIELEHTTAVRNFYAWPHVIARVLRGLLGLGRARSAAPLTFAKRQIGFKLMIEAGLYSYYEGGLLRRLGKRWHAPREVVYDEEARRHYLGAQAPIPTHLPEQLAQDGTMESLPILRRHRLGAAPAPAASGIPAAR